MADVQETNTQKSVCAPEDRLRAENLQLRLQNVQLQLQVMQAELQKAVQTRSTLLAEMENVRAEFLTKYNVDLVSAKINPDGTFEKLNPLQGLIK